MGRPRTCGEADQVKKTTHSGCRFVMPLPVLASFFRNLAVCAVSTRDEYPLRGSRTTVTVSPGAMYPAPDRVENAIAMNSPSCRGHGRSSGAVATTAAPAPGSAPPAPPPSSSVSSPSSRSRTMGAEMWPEALGWLPARGSTALPAPSPRAPAPPSPAAAVAAWAVCAAAGVGEPLTVPQMPQASAIGVLMKVHTGDAAVPATGAVAGAHTPHAHTHTHTSAGGQRGWGWDVATRDGWQGEAAGFVAIIRKTQPAVSRAHSTRSGRHTTDI